MRRSALRLYGPFLVLVAIQAAFIVAAPSKGPDRQVSAGQFTAPLAGDPLGIPAAPLIPGDPSATTVPAAAPSASAPQAAGSSDGPTPTTSAGVAAPTGQAAPAPATAAPVQDTSHCTPLGFQHDHYFLDDEAPRCRARWPEGADNGGATYNGVSGDEILIIHFDPNPNAAVDALLGAQGLARTEPETLALIDAANTFFNEGTRYETYGRKIRFEQFYGNCPLTPPDVPACKAAAREVIRKQPFMVLFESNGLYPTVFDEFAREGIISVGGWHFGEEFFTGRRPFRYDIFMDGTQTVRNIAEYYCKKLAKKPASHAGVLIHPQIGGRNTPRRLGIVTPDTDANLGPANLLKRLVSDCDASEPIVAPYVSNIETAAEQSRATNAKFIAEGITTVVCVCDPVAPIFSTQGSRSSNYFPEHLIPGSGLLDFDKLARLYDQSQWAHAFGLGHLPVTRAFTDERVSKAHAASGLPAPCDSCNLPWSYFELAAHAVHYAGPNLSPLTVEQSFANGVQYGGIPLNPLVNFGPGDYTGIGDAQEIHWSTTKTSPQDGRPGAYVNVDGGKRYRLGQWGTQLKIPVAAQ